MYEDNAEKIACELAPVGEFVERIGNHKVGKEIHAFVPNAERTWRVSLDEIAASRRRSLSLVAELVEHMSPSGSHASARWPTMSFASAARAAGRHERSSPRSLR